MDFTLKRQIHHDLRGGKVRLELKRVGKKWSNNFILKIWILVQGNLFVRIVKNMNESSQNEDADVKTYTSKRMDTQDNVVVIQRNINEGITMPKIVIEKKSANLTNGLITTSFLTWHDGLQYGKAINE